MNTDRQSAVSEAGKPVNTDRQSATFVGIMFILATVSSMYAEPPLCASVPRVTKI